VDATFDPYYTWLGIPPAEQPANLYRLLGISLFESNPEVISNAADRQMAHLRSFAIGERSHFSQQILNEISAARIRLLNPMTKAEYDQALTQTMAMPPGDAVAQPQSPVATPTASSALAASSPPSEAVPAALPHRKARRGKRSRRSSASNMIQLVSVVAGGVLGTAIGYFIIFVYIPALRARHAAQPVSPVAANSRVASTARRKTTAAPQPSVRTKQKKTPTSKPAPARPATSRAHTARPRSSPTPPKSNPTSAATNSVAMPRGQQPTSRSAFGSARNQLPRPQQPFNQTSPSVRAAPVRPTPLDPLPATFTLPPRSTVGSQTIASLDLKGRLLQIDLLDRAAPLAASERIVLQRLQEDGIVAWSVAVLDSTSTENSRDEISEFTFADDELLFRWFAGANETHESLLKNCLLRLNCDEHSRVVSLRQPQQSKPLKLDMSKRREVHTFTINDLPNGDLLKLSLGELTNFPNKPQYRDDKRTAALGENVVIEFEEVPGAEIEFKFIAQSSGELAIAVTPRFRENAASRIAMTKGNLDTRYRAAEKSIVKTNVAIAQSQAAIRSLRRQRGNDGKIDQLNEKIDDDRETIRMLQTTLANGPKFLKFFESLERTATVPFRIAASVEDQATIALVEAGIPSSFQ
jgi:hypothetical protein